MDLVNFYNRFHKKGSIQNKVISDKNFTYRIVLSVIRKEVEDKKNLSILDFGCGVGTVSFFMASKGNSVIGLDISKDAVDIANKSAKLMKVDKLAKFYDLETGKRKVNKRKFDLILCIEVIEHIEQDRELVNYLAKLLKKKGVLVISTPSMNAPLKKLGLTNDFDKKAGHLRRYDVEKLVKMVKSTGLNVKKVIKTEGLIRNSLFLFPVLSKFIRYVRGPISDLLTFIDNLIIPLFGESDIFVVSKKP